MFTFILDYLILTLFNISTLKALSLLGRFSNSYPHGRFTEKELLKGFLLWAVSVRIFK
jgi:hypothetical protein